MDPITSINMEFARELRREWSSETAAQRSKRPTPARQSSPTDRLRWAIGDRLISAGLWLKAHTTSVTINQ